MTIARPAARPKLSRADLHARIAVVLSPAEQAAWDASPVRVVGIRGYYERSLGRPDRNDRGIYDDALFVDSPRGTWAFNGNTDPSRVRNGQGFGPGKGMAMLKPGLYRAHRFGQHKGQYTALVQLNGPVTVLRDAAAGPYEDRGYFGINIHRGGWSTTSSEGCQTLPPDQWDEFLKRVELEARQAHGGDYAKHTIPYLLLEES